MRCIFSPRLSPLGLPLVSCVPCAVPTCPAPSEGDRVLTNVAVDRKRLNFRRPIARLPLDGKRRRASYAQV